MPRILNEVDGVQNLTRSSSVQSNASIIIGKGAAVTIRTKEFGDLELSVSLHIIINVKSGSEDDGIFFLMSLTCCRPRGILPAECAVVMSLDVKASVRFAVLLEEESFNLLITLGMVRMYPSDLTEFPCGAIIMSCSSQVKVYWIKARFSVSFSESKTTHNSDYDVLALLLIELKYCFACWLKGLQTRYT